MNARTATTATTFLVAAALPLGSAATAAPVILNEYNAVGPEKFLDTDDFAGSTKTDTRLGRVQGNGLNWFELAVVGDGTNGSTVDMRGWQLRWAETKNDTGAADGANGTDIWFGDGSIEQGILTLTNDTFWSSVRAGTLITFGEQQTLTSEAGATVVDGSDTGINFSVGDNWAHVHSFDPTLVTTTTNVTGDSAGNFSVGNDDWQLTILDAAAAAVVFGPTGEGIPSGTGISSNEVFKLEAQATTSILPNSSGEGTGFTTAPAAASAPRTPGPAAIFRRTSPPSASCPSPAPPRSPSPASASSAPAAAAAERPRVAARRDVQLPAPRSAGSG